MKLFRLITIACAVSVVLISTAAFGLPSPQNNQPKRVAPTNPAPVVESQADQADNPACYLRLASGKTLNLTQLCGDQAEGSRLQSSYPQPPTVYDTPAIKAFDDSIYGPGG